MGIFFIVNDSIIADKISDKCAAKNKFFIEHGEHYNFWLNLNPATKSDGDFKAHAYDYYPRGRVVIDIQLNKISLFIDRCAGESAINQVIKMFELYSKQIQVRYDEHYQCHSCNKQFLDDQNYPVDDFDD